MKLTGFFPLSLREVLTMAVSIAFIGGLQSHLGAAPQPVFSKECTKIAKDVFKDAAENPNKASEIVETALKDHPKCADAICSEISKNVFDRVAENPKKAEDIIAIAVKNYPKCASEIVSKGIAALSPIRPGNDYKDVMDPKDGDPRVDPKIVESILATVLNYIKGDPELMDTIIQTVLETYPEIKPDIPGILAGIYIDPLKRGDSSDVTVGPTPTPTPTPGSQVPVSPDGPR
jgi:hypothetical protein